MKYITEYSELSPQERRQLKYKRLFKRDFPNWDDTLVLLTNLSKEYMPENAKVLDAGCGNGNYVIDELSDNFSEKVGIDLQPCFTEKNICLDKIVFGDLSSLPFGSHDFDATVSLWVLEHTNDPERVFSEISRVLKIGGVFAFATPNKSSYLILLRRLLNKRVVYLSVNFDPSYTSFNRLTYKINTILYSLGFTWFDSHIVGVLKKTSKF